MTRNNTRDDTRGRHVLTRRHALGYGAALAATAGAGLLHPALAHQAATPPAATPRPRRCR